nr:sensor histidine kinase [uncultured Cohaesibacter sp.]
MRYSIQKRLLKSAMLVLIAVGVISGFIVLQLSNTASDEAHDKVLGAAAMTIAETISFGESGVTVDLPYAAFAILGTSGKNRIFYRVVAPDGSTVTGTPVLGIDQSPLTFNESRFFDSEYRGETIRVVQIAHFFQGRRGGGWFNVFVGETREARNQLATHLASFALLPAILATILGLVLISLAIRSSFSPLRAIETSIRQRNPTDMSAIDVDVPLEVATLVGSINQFMARLEATLEGLRQVTADAAHQLRTPLSAVRALSELAMDQDLPAPLKNYISRINKNAISATQLASQLMTEAQLLHSLETERFKQINLTHLTAKVVETTIAEMRFQVELPDINHPQEEDPACFIEGNEAAMGELIKNLLINAILHGAGPIDLCVWQDGSHVRLAVKDRGPGIPDAIRETVFERFVKDPDKQSGTGLGLAIVKQIVTANGGRVWLRKREKGGLVIDLQFAASSKDNKVGQGRQ